MNREKRALVILWDDGPPKNVHRFCGDEIFTIWFQCSARCQHIHTHTQMMTRWKHTQTLAGCSWMKNDYLQRLKLWSYTLMWAKMCIAFCCPHPKQYMRNMANTSKSAIAINKHTNQFTAQLWQHTVVVLLLLLFLVFFFGGPFEWSKKERNEKK